MTINFDDIIEYFASVHPSSCEIDSLRAALRTFNQKRRFARYHGGEILNHYRNIAPEGVSKLAHYLTNTTAKEPTEEGTRLKNSHFQTIAHAYAFVSVMHSMSDITAKCVFLYLSLRSSWGDVTPVNLSTIKPRLKGHAFVDLVTSIEALLDDPWYKYISALNNFAKHHELVTVSIPFATYESNNEWIGFQFGRFSYKGKTYEKIVIIEMVEEGFRTLFEKYCKILESMRLVRLES